MDLIVCFLASLFQITLRNLSSAGWECMMHEKCHIIRKACELFYRMPEKKFTPRRWSKFLPLLVKISTFKGQFFWPLKVKNFDLWRLKFLPSKVKKFDLQRSKFRPSKVKIFDLQRSKFRPSKVEILTNSRQTLHHTYWIFSTNVLVEISTN